VFWFFEVCCFRCVPITSAPAVPCCCLLEQGNLDAVTPYICNNVRQGLSLCSDALVRGEVVVFQRKDDARADQLREVFNAGLPRLAERVELKRLQQALFLGTQDQRLIAP
jgi:hypothetical protein